MISLFSARPTSVVFGLLPKFTKGTVVVYSFENKLLKFEQIFSKIFEVILPYY